MEESAAAVGCGRGGGGARHPTPTTPPPVDTLHVDGGMRPRTRRERGLRWCERDRCEEMPGGRATQSMEEFALLSATAGSSPESSTSEVSDPEGDKADISSGAGTDGGGGEVVLPVTKARKSIGSKLWSRLFSFGSWRKETQLQANAAVAVATLRGIDVDGDDDIELSPKYGFIGTMRQAVNDKLSESKHNVRHRAARRFRERVRVLKTLSAELKFQSHGFDKTEADMRSLAIAAKGVVDKAIDDKTIHRSYANWYKRGLVACYHIQDEDDEFFARMAAVAEKSPH